jgi:hypothetical protein
MSAQSELGAELRVPFRCPDCRTEGWAYWRQLPRGMRCHTCGGSFWIGADGQLHSASQAKKLRFRCPRCTSEHEYPEELVGAVVECASCGLRVERVHQWNAKRDGRRELPIAPSQPARERGKGALNARFRWCVLTVVIGMGGALVISILGVPGTASVVTAEEAAAEFTRLCFAGRIEEAAGLVEGRSEDFRVWRLLHGASDAAGSARVAPRTTVRVLHADGANAVLRVTLDRPTQGTSMHTQHWIDKPREGWRFDVRSTLRAMVKAQSGE